ncbi:MAG: LPS export ABC transporter ATP-binding protein [Bradyrhizobium sp.]|uniref:LPS export ABC transporter ATP-binding protein n=1 Tax=Bradyrhizobium sp. TaxID=376 RepID=UPI002A3386A6|nr:LPS export ABC transporter ATP-binding protein [Bradyrhizobium sp.]
MLVASHLSKRHRMRDVTSDISIHVERGEAVALLGPNGAGKTTLFQMIAGILMPDSGSILLDGEDVTFMPIHERARRGLNYLPQEPSLFRSLTVEQNILIVIEAYEVDAVRRQRFADRLLERFGLEHVRRASAGRISGGERRRCEIARTLAARPVFVLFDEPFAGIDPIAIEEIRAAIRYLTGHGLGVLITDHSVEETLASVDRAYVVDSGRVVCEGSPERIFNHSGVRALYLEDRTEFEP